MPLVRHLGRKVDETVLKIKNMNNVMSETHQLSDQVHPSPVHLVSHLFRTGLQ